MVLKPLALQETFLYKLRYCLPTECKIVLERLYSLSELHASVEIRFQSCYKIDTFCDRVWKIIAFTHSIIARLTIAATKLATKIFVGHKPQSIVMLHLNDKF